MPSPGPATECLMRTTTTRFALLFVAVAPFVSCSFFSPAPALPRHAEIESKSSDEKFAALIDAADIIYFPSEAADLARRSNIGARLLESLHRSGSSFAMASDAGSEAEFQRRLVLEGKRLKAEMVELHPMPEATSDESSRGRDMEPVTDESIAGRIVAYVKEHREVKLLAFLRHDRLTQSGGVPHLVAQQTKARQLVLNPQVPSRHGPGLMARRKSDWRLVPGRFEIVDRTPFAGTD
ncbi:MAG: hypothetical protein ACJ8M4_01665 [Chthoniobacterales bacterium]